MQVEVEQFERRHLLAADALREFVSGEEGEFVHVDIQKARSAASCNNPTSLQECPHEARDRADEARDQHLLAGADAAGALRASAAARRPKATRLRAAYRGTGSAIGAFIELAERRGRRGRDADRRQRVAERPGRGRAPSSTSRGASATRWRRAATASCSTCTARWSRESHEDGEGELLRRIRAIAPTCRSPSRSTCTPTSTTRCAAERDRDRRLPDLSARRHVRDRPARRPRAARAAAGRGQAGDGVGPPADAAARDAPGQRRFAEPRAAGALPGDGGAKARCAPACSSAFRTPTSSTPGCRRWS